MGHLVRRHVELLIDKIICVLPLNRSDLGIPKCKLFILVLLLSYLIQKIIWGKFKHNRWSSLVVQDFRLRLALWRSNITVLS